ncbi:MAG TPA: endonuclease III [Candidatus Dormibacteraeota bacterium]|nr:endonuclease III [Candidatus Dormibacteraeota bacterium]
MGAPVAAPPGVELPKTPRQRALATVATLAQNYPAACALDHADPLQLLVATILSAQTTDQKVNQVTPDLFARFPAAADYAGADPEELEKLIHATGFFRAKARSLIGMGRVLCDEFEGQVPDSMEGLTKLPGVGRKTANVILGVAFGKPGFPVDTHVIRLTNRLGLVRVQDPVKIEAEVCRMVPSLEWTGLSLRLILHGREVCLARTPRCQVCILESWCPSSSLRLGRKPKKSSTGRGSAASGARGARSSPRGRPR